MIEYIEKRHVIDELMDYASKWFAYDPYNKIVARIFQDIELIIKGIPSTDVINPKHGEWIESRYVDEEWVSHRADFYKCSICGKRVNLFQMRSYRFCPNCGADMQKESE